MEHRIINELKIYLTEFAKSNQHDEILEKALQIPDFNYNEYEALFNLKDYSKIGGGILEQVASIPYRTKLNRLKELLIKLTQSWTLVLYI